MSREPKQARAEKRRASLLDAAAALLDRHGYGAVTTNAIAKEAGAAVGTVYDYFPDKAAVLSALLERYRERLQHTIMGALAEAGTDTNELVERSVRAFARFYQEEPGYAQLWLGSQLIAPLREAGDAWGQEFGGLIAQLVRQQTGKSETDAARAALTLVHAVSSVITLALTQKDSERDALIEEAVLLAKAYLSAQAPT